MTSKRVGKYYLKSEIGRGMFGIVYRGYNSVTNEEVAVKSIDRKALDEKSLR